MTGIFRIENGIGILLPMGSQKSKPKIRIFNQAGLWCHTWWTINFCLVVVNFGIKVTDLEDFHHLKKALEEDYKVTVNWTSLLFCSIKFMWDYKQCHVNCSMPGYISNSLKKYQHPTLLVPQVAPYTAAPIQYGAKVHPVETNTTSPLFPENLKGVQDIVGTLLYYA
jgi:hypothetical protein